MINRNEQFIPSLIRILFRYKKYVVQMFYNINFINKEFQKKMGDIGEGNHIQQERTSKQGERRILKKINIPNGIQIIIKMMIIVLLVKLSTTCPQSNCYACANGTACAVCKDIASLSVDGYCCYGTLECEICSNTFGLNNICSKCNSGYYLDTYNICNVSPNCKIANNLTKACRTCNPGYNFDRNNICTNINNCDVSNPATQKCTTCSAGYYLDSQNYCTLSRFCVVSRRNDGLCTQCNSGYYIDSQNYCTTSLFCSMSRRNDSICTSCNNGYYLDSQNYCTTTQFCDVSDHTNQSCTKCNNGYYLDSQNYCATTQFCDVSDHTNQSCTTCSTGYYFDSQKYCTSSQFCDVSRQNDSICTSCNNGYYLDSQNYCTISQFCAVSDHTNQSCTKCNSGYYLDSENYCTTSPNCKQSSHANQTCTICNIGFHFDTVGFCTAIENCEVSNIITQKCTKCASGYYLDSQNYCVKSVNCALSDHTSQLCTKCQQGYILNNATCLPASYYENTKPANVNQIPRCFSIYVFLSSTKNLIKSDFDSLKLSTVSTGKRLLQDTTLTILNITIVSNSQIIITLANPQVSIAANSYLVISLNNPSITLSSTVYRIPNQIRSQDSLNQLTPKYPQLIISAVFISVLIIIILILTMYHSKFFHLHRLDFCHYYKTINFIQRISLLRFNIPTVSSQLLLFGYYLKASYFNFGGIPNPDYPYNYIIGNIPISSNYNESYFQPTKGGFSLIDVDANLIRNVGVAIIISIIMFALKIIGFIMFKKHPQYQWKNSYYSFVQFFEKIVRFPIIYFCIATLYFQQIFPVESYPDPQRYNSFKVAAIIYLVYFITLAVIEAIFTQTETSLRVVRSFQFICDMMNAVILILTLGSNQTLLLILTIVLQFGLTIALNSQKQSKYVCCARQIITSSKVTKFYIVKIIGTTLEIVLLIVIMTSQVNIDGNGNLIVAIIFFLLVIICYLISMFILPNDYQVITQVNAMPSISQNVAMQSVNAFTINDNKDT